MATRPDQPPESIILGNFEGVRNTSARHRLKPEELEQALNVDIDGRILGGTDITAFNMAGVTMSVSVETDDIAKCSLRARMI